MVRQRLRPFMARAGKLGAEHSMLEVEGAAEISDQSTLHLTQLASRALTSTIKLLLCLELPHLPASCPRNPTIRLR